MGFKESLKTCFEKYADFSGRASPPEYWWFFLFAFTAAVIGWIATIWIPYLGVIVSLALLLPFLSVMARRLHDTNRAGWWMLLPIGVGVAGYTVGTIIILIELEILGVIVVFLTPIAGFLVLLRFLINPSDLHVNHYGPDPRQPDMAVGGYGSVVQTYNSPDAPAETGRQRYCEQCGVKRLPGARFCLMCGAAFRLAAFLRNTDAE